MFLQKSSNGNVVFLVLIAVILTAALTFVLSRDQSNNATARLDTQRAAAMGQQLVQYAASVANAVTQITSYGNVVSDVSFQAPSDGNFNNDTGVLRIRKVFHPMGGGVSAFNASDLAYFNPSSARRAGWTAITSRNIQWTETTSNDILFAFVDINPTICAEINRRINGSTAIPLLNASSVDAIFLSGSADLNTTNCLSCQSQYNLCVRDGTGVHAYYSIVGAQ